MTKTCIVFLSHFQDAEILSRFDRLVRECPADADVFFALNHRSVNEQESQAGPAHEAGRLIPMLWSDLRALPYPGKTRDENWTMNGNSDLVFLNVWRLKPGYDHYWFVEYDVHYEGRWTVFFEYFRRSPADILATMVYPAAAIQNVVDFMHPRLQPPSGQAWPDENVVKGFLPVCRLSHAMLTQLDRDYRDGMVGHYEVTIPTVAANRGFIIEDVGGQGPYVRPENRRRFYFATARTYTHSPGTFVFRPPITRILRRDNTLWHPVKPAEAPAWFPLYAGGSPAKQLLENAKLLLWPCLIWLWFCLLWNPLSARDAAETGRLPR